MRSREEALTLRGLTCRGKGWDLLLNWYHFIAVAKGGVAMFHLSFFFFFFFFWLYPRHMEVPGLGVELELQLPAYATATAIQDPSCICDLHCSLQQCRILNPLSEARDQT